MIDRHQLLLPFPICFLIWIPLMIRYHLISHHQKTYKIIYLVQPELSVLAHKCTPTNPRATIPFQSSFTIIYIFLNKFYVLSVLIPTAGELTWLPNRGVNRKWVNHSIFIV